MCRSILLFSLQLPGNSTGEMYCLINITQKETLRKNTNTSSLLLIIPLICYNITRNTLNTNLGVRFQRTSIDSTADPSKSPATGESLLKFTDKGTSVVPLIAFTVFWLLSLSNDNVQ